MANPVIARAGQVLLGAGLSKAATAGILGNALQESSWNPGAVGSGGGGLWGFTAHPQSLGDLQQFAASRGANWKDPATQAHFLLQHLSAGDKAALNSQRTPQQAALWFMNNWERPLASSENAARRVQGAQQAFQQLGGLGGASGSSSLGAASTLSAMPGGRTVSTTSNVFNAAGFQQASQRAVAGQYLAGQSAKSDPYAAGAPKTGLSTAASSNPLLTSGELTTSAPNPQSFVHAQTTLQHLAGNAPLNQHPAAFAQNLKGSGYTNPLPGATWERTDMGVDASMPNGAPIRALGDSKVTNIHTFYQGQPIITMQLLSGPMAGKFWYVSEAINSNLRPGQVVRRGQTIGTYNIHGTGLELGWAGNAQGSTLAQTQGNTGGPGHSNSPAGRSFRNFLNSIGAHAG